MRFIHRYARTVWDATGTGRAEGLYKKTRRGPGDGSNWKTMSKLLRSDDPHPLRIFLVENHADTLKWMTRYLEAAGHAVVSAKTMACALAMFPQANCDVLISDIGLPDGDGWELLRTVRLAQPIFAIAMSGFGMNADHVKSKSAGYRHHLLKPFVPDELDAALAEAARELAGCR